MKTFLEYVAQDIIEKYGTDLSRIAVVFPNKRASLFLNDHLTRLVDKPIWSPAYITISELFRSKSQLTVADPIKLICDLYKSFIKYTDKKEETLDHFYGWGQILLADFDDIDKNMADAAKVFANVRDIHEMDDVSYLSSEQIEIIQRFFSNFSANQNSRLKEEFLQLWSHLHDIYEDYNDTLAQQQLAYEGALYRKVVEKTDVEFEYDTYLFIGFNMTQRVEQRMFEILQEQGKAKFYWDFDNYYMPNKDNHVKEAGHFIAQYLQRFPNELDITRDEIYNCFSAPRTINFVSANTENIQARYISTWLKEDKKGRITDGRKTAIVMGNEGLLQTVIHCLPSDVEHINITTGYPLSQSPVSSLVTLLLNLQTLGYNTNTQKYRLHQVNNILQHPYARLISASYGKLLTRINDTQKVYYPNAEILGMDDDLKRLFCPIGSEPGKSFGELLLNWLLDVLKLIASHSQEEKDPLFQESLFRTYTLINRLSNLCKSGDLNVDISTLRRLIDQLIQGTSIPFHGEPAIGLQVMGVLETRNLDFDHILLLSCNEGNLPKGVNDTSFIPYSIRKAYGLTTIDHKVAIYAYYFHRLLQRAQDITLVYNNATNDTQKGEMSRFMLQLMAECKHPINRINLQAHQEPLQLKPVTIEKTDKILQHMRRKYDIDLQNDDRKKSVLLSASAINKYMRCQLQYFYQHVEGIIEPDDNDEDEIDNRIFGNIFHEAAERIYRKLSEQSNTITAAQLQGVRKAKVDMERVVDEAFNNQLFKTKLPTERINQLFNGTQLLNREVILRYLDELLRVDEQLAPFDIIKLEGLVTAPLSIKSGDKQYMTTIGGYIDRLDIISDSESTRIRVVDYKTGGSQPSPLNTLEDIFNTENLRKHSDYYLQTFLYGKIVTEDKQYNPNALPVSPALLFIQHAHTENYDPTLKFGKEPILDISSYLTGFNANLNHVVADIFNPEKPFTPTEDKQICATCPYAQLCRRGV